MELDLVVIRHERACHFKKRASVGGKKRNGCEHCGLSKYHPDHLGAPESFNAFATTPQFSVYQALKKRWGAVLAPLLQESGLPRGLDRVLVEGEATFPDRAHRDQGNHRVMLEKALGDVLQNGYGDVAGGWLEDDTWDRYEFGNLRKRYEKGVSATTLTLFPVAKTEAVLPGC